MVAMEFVAVFCFISIVCANEDITIIDAIQLESPCLFEGGMCVIANDCPEGWRTGPGLCPMQQSRGVECCYGVSMKETRCRKRGGVCLPECVSSQVYRQATGCPEDTVCCSVSFR
ncbi:unnamed protein product [Chrysodeixis includens]|uniref:Uncharacterized protein n=1 Tax=Chrysodeixis includens TaxID=689277 RepID=A0A9P0C233_CHRIL|nr:unnamed protein product [Chrysodeixis includens]